MRPVEEQGEWESRALWAKVAKGIREGDFDTAAREKSRIEVGAPFALSFIFYLIALGFALTERAAPKKA